VDAVQSGISFLKHVCPTAIRVFSHLTNALKKGKTGLNGEIIIKETFLKKTF
jgi:hypothetical protein